jgi:hypothetical protein
MHRKSYQTHGSKGVTFPASPDTPRFHHVSKGVILDPDEKDHTDELEDTSRPASWQQRDQTYVTHV